MQASASFCPDCGPATVSHWSEWCSAAADRLMTPLTWPFGAVTRAVGPLLYALHAEYFFAPFFRLLAALGLGTITHDLDDKDNLRTRALWESAKKRGIVMWQFRLFGNPNIEFFFARRPEGGRLLFFEGLPRPGTRSSASLDWMDDKGTLKKHLLAAGLPTARGASCATEAHARKVFREVGAPLIAKPSIGSRSRHTTVGIHTEAELVAAFHKAQQLSPWVMIEKELAGNVFRATMLGGKVAGVIRREYPAVTGDGTSTIRQLVIEENKKPPRHRPIFHEIPMDKDSEAELAAQGLGWESVPPAGREVVIGMKVSRSFGAPTTDVTDITHPDTIAMCEAVARLLNDPVIGIDFMLRDITRSWKEQEPCGVIECNSLPFIDLHHYPFSGKARDVAGMLWDLVLPAKKAVSEGRVQAATGG